MFKSAIDRNALNGLFDNQKKLDDLFDSIFDDDDYFISSTISSAAASTQSRCVAYEADRGRSRASKHNPIAESVLMLKNQCPYFFVLPVMVEIAAVYFVVSHLL